MSVSNIAYTCNVIYRYLYKTIKDLPYIFIIHQEQTQSNRVWNFHVIFLWEMLPMDEFVSRFFP
jgi:hypothetical protein